MGVVCLQNLRHCFRTELSLRQLLIVFLIRCLLHFYLQLCLPVWMLLYETKMIFAVILHQKHHSNSQWILKKSVFWRQCCILRFSSFECCNSILKVIHNFLLLFIYSLWIGCDQKAERRDEEDEKECFVFAISCLWDEDKNGEHYDDKKNNDEYLAFCELAFHSLIQ